MAAAALNVRDVMVALDLLPLEAYQQSALGRQVGIEASGTVRQVGGQVTGVRPGDPVVFLRGGCVASRVTVDERAVFPVPDVLTAEQAAASLSAYVTAYYALVDLARLRPGQRVLVHSALGGVGQAAIALARRAGAVVYATAGTEARRASCSALGVAAAFDSHSFGWYDELMEATGDGVDVVLNSLAGPHIELCLRALRPGGWHCEIGKADIYADTALGLSVFAEEPALRGHRHRPADARRPGPRRELTLDCLRLLADGRRAAAAGDGLPLRGLRRRAAFMASGQPEGKIVLASPADPAPRGRRPAAVPRPRGDLPGHRGPRRLRPWPAGLSGVGRSPAPHAARRRHPRRDTVPGGDTVPGATAGRP